MLQKLSLWNPYSLNAITQLMYGAEYNSIVYCIALGLAGLRNFSGGYSISSKTHLLIQFICALLQQQSILLWREMYRRVFCGKSVAAEVLIQFIVQLIQNIVAGWRKTTKSRTNWDIRLEWRYVPSIFSDTLCRSLV